MDESETAILVRGATKQYTKNGKFVLDNLDMTVAKGTIYGLLGSSGCGKTTLLSAIVGTRVVQTGTIEIFGRAPDRAAVKSIGYMPQEVALVNEFSVKGALQHFGWIFGMTDEEIEERYQFLSRLLDLPPPDRLVKNLSGGQQRRVSLAVVLVHNPKVLILDEPTVGLDPVLRKNIWDYLVKITREENKSIIITTHYIEEANQAHQLGLMRNGKILEEGAPQDLLTKYNCSTIENVFLLLSIKQQEGYYDRKDSNANRIANLQNPKKAKSYSLKSNLCFTNKGHTKALLTKNFLRFKRHPGTLIFAFFFPVIQMFTLFMAIGRVPNDLKIGIVNEELGNYTDCREYQVQNFVGGYFIDNETCAYNGLSCRFIDEMGDKLRYKIYYKTMDEAFDAVKQRRINHFIYFPKNYSETITSVRNNSYLYNLNNVELEFQEISVYRDVIDHTLSEVFLKELYDAFKRYSEKLAVDCNVDPHYERIPIFFNEPVYGKEDLTYRDMVAPGMIAIVSVFLTMGISTLSITTERTEGIWERTIVAGVTPSEILIFHTVTLCCVSIIQIIELFVISFAIFELECQGNKLTAFLLIYLQSIVGICFGVCISVFTKSVTEANFTSLGIFYPFITLTGCFWPLEGMPVYLRYLSYLVPLTLTSQSLADVIHRGWGFGHYRVYMAFFASLGFICIFTLISIVKLRYEKKR